MTLRSIGLLSVAVVFAAGCAAQAPIATPTTAPVAAATSTKAAAAPTATPTKRPLIKATLALGSISLSAMPALIGRALGFWPEEGLDVDWVTTGSGVKSLTAAVTGSADFSIQSFVPEVVKAIDSGQKVKTIAVFQRRGVEILAMNPEVAAQRGVRRGSSLADIARSLRGLTIAAASPTSSTYEFLKAILAEGGLNEERDITVTFIGDVNAVVAAMSQKSIDAFSQSTVAAGQSVVAGDAVVLASAPDGDRPRGGDPAALGLVSREETISNRSEILDGALRVIWRGQRYFRDDAAGAVKALMTLEAYANMNEEAFRLSVELLRNAVTETPLLSKEQFSDMVRLHNSTVKAEEQTKITMQQFFDDGPTLRAKKQLGF